VTLLSGQMKGRETFLRHKHSQREQLKKNTLHSPHLASQPIEVRA
jgi:hypothetical protein